MSGRKLLAVVLVVAIVAVPLVATPTLAQDGDGSGGEGTGGGDAAGEASESGEEGDEGEEGGIEGAIGGAIEGSGLLGAVLVLALGVVLLTACVERLISYLTRAALGLKLSLFALSIVFTGLEFDDTILGLVLAAGSKALRSGPRSGRVSRSSASRSRSQRSLARFRSICPPTTSPCSHWRRWYSSRSLSWRR